jgi:hypothetical protein
MSTRNRRCRWQAQFVPCPRHDCLTPQIHVCNLHGGIKNGRQSQLQGTSRPEKLSPIELLHPHMNLFSFPHRSSCFNHGPCCKLHDGVRISMHKDNVTLSLLHVTDLSYNLARRMCHYTLSIWRAIGMASYNSKGKIRNSENGNK